MNENCIAICLQERINFIWLIIACVNINVAGILQAICCKSQLKKISIFNPDCSLH